MITLKTLPEATAQEVFDQVAKHLLTQNETSYCDDAVGVCAYRGPDGLKCAAGCLIADDEYNTDWEQQGWTVLVDSRAVPLKHHDLIRSLQMIHDEYDQDSWREHLTDLADKHKLNTAALN